eukprot:scaffold11491_cov19-Tisochrysis_lutea.AAC.3
MAFLGPPCPAPLATSPLPSHVHKGESGGKQLRFHNLSFTFPQPSCGWSPSSLSACGSQFDV